MASNFEMVLTIDPESMEQLRRLVAVLEDLSSKTALPDDVRKAVRETIQFYKDDNA